MKDNIKPSKENENKTAKVGKSKLNYANSMSLRKKSPRHYTPVEQPEWDKSYPRPVIVNKPVGHITTVNQFHDLDTVKDEVITKAECQTSTDWLEQHSVLNEKLTVDDLLKLAPSIRGDDTDAKGTSSLGALKLTAGILEDFKSKLTKLIQLIEGRTAWLLSSSRRIFGLVKAENPCILIDCSDTNIGFKRLHLMKQSLNLLIDEQLCKKTQVQVVSFGTHACALWNTPRDVNYRIIQELHHWKEMLTPSGSVNVLQALRIAFKQRDIDCIVLVMGNCPNQNPKVITDYVLEAMIGRDIMFHTVAYNCSISANNKLLAELAEATGGRFHCYMATNEEDIMTGTDLSLLSKELQVAKMTLQQVNDLKSGSTVNGKFLAVVERPCTDLVKVNKQKDSDNDSGIANIEDSKMSVEGPSCPIRTSSQWMLTHGLRAKGLTLYQVMAPNAFSYVTQYIGSINREVTSQLHHKSMVQLEWHDGSTKNVHVDPVLLHEYQHMLQVALQLYRRRLEWLTLASKKIFGTIVEERVVLIFDTSYGMHSDAEECLNSFKRLLEEQMANKKLFNVICYGGQTDRFRDTMVEPLSDCLNICWRWVRKQEIRGTRKFLSAFRQTVENEEERKLHMEVDAIYLITSAIPDEKKEVACSYVEESLACTGASLHVVYMQPSEFSVQSLQGQFADPDTTADYLRELAHRGRGRFHWVKSGEIMESDDLKRIVDEMEKANNYFRKSEMLLEKIKQKREEKLSALELVPKPPEVPKQQPPTNPRHTALTQARLKMRPKSAKPCHKPKRPVVPKKRPESAKPALAWKSNTQYSDHIIPPVPEPVPGKKFKDISERRVYEEPNPSHQIFYTEIGNVVGTMHARQPTATATHQPAVAAMHTRCVSSWSVPEAEESLSTKEWLQHYGLNKLKLDLNQIIAKAECKVSSEKVAVLGNKSVHAKVCEMFPSIMVDGKVKHLHIKPGEFSDYEAKLELTMKRYVQRMKWLLTGSRRVFGTLLEKNVVVLIDVSGSMVGHIDELKEEISLLITEQFYKEKRNFNLIQYSTEVVSWRTELAEPTEENCQEAIRWVKQMQAFGKTATLGALQTAFDNHRHLEGVYLLTDGKPDHSTSSVLREAANMNMQRGVKIHTISFNCSDSTANKFLQMLALQSKARYHRYQDGRAGSSQLFTQQILKDGFHEEDPRNPVQFEGDDLKRLAKEITLCRQFMLTSRSYRTLFEKPKSASSSSTELLNLRKPNSQST